MTGIVSRPFALCAIAFGISAALSSAGVWAAAPAHASSGIAWQKASSDAEVDKAFAMAKQSGKPVFLYWGAVWCPPCNQVKATLFSRSDFVERSRAFVPVYVDGDKPGAQKVAARFKVAGYPTMIIFKPDGTEITRLPGEVDPQRYLMTMTAGMNAQVPVKELVRRAVAKQPLTPEQWRLLAYYSWDTDEQQVFGTTDLPQKLADLAAVAPADQPLVRARLALKSLAAKAQSKSTADGIANDSARKMIERIVADPESVRQLAEIMVGYAETIVKHVAGSGEGRRSLASKWEKALAQLSEDPSLSRGDQIDLLDARVAMWKVMDDSEKLSAEHRSQVLRGVAKVVAATTDRYERQAVVPGAAHLLTSAGLVAESDELLKQELPRAVAPYYHMLVLAGNAKARDDVKGALYWYEQAWKKSEGPATRIQWGTGFVNQVVDLSPTDVAKVESAASGVVSQLDPKSETFYERNQRSLKKMAARLVKWQGTDPARAKTVEKVKVQLAKTCSKLPAGDVGRANCDNVFPNTAT